MNILEDQGIFKDSSAGTCFTPGRKLGGSEYVDKGCNITPCSDSTASRSLECRGCVRSSGERDPVVWKREKKYSCDSVDFTGITRHVFCMESRCDRDTG